MKVRCPNCNCHLPLYSLGDHFACQNCGERLRSSLTLPVVVFLLLFGLTQLLWSFVSARWFGPMDGANALLHLVFSAVAGLILFALVFTALAGRVVRY